MIGTRTILEELRKKPLHRMITIERSAINLEDRTVSLAFASDKPIDQYFGSLSLSMKGKSMRDARLRSGAPLLMDHDPKDQIGVIQSHSIGSDGVARAIVRFGESVRAKEIFQDVKTGIRQGVSVGFMIHDMKQESGKDSYRSDDWEPFELSIVSVPADMSVGIGRSRNLENKMNTENNDLSLAAADEIREWGQAFGEEAAASTYLRNSIGENGSFRGTKNGFFATLRDSPSPLIATPHMDPADQAYQQNGIQLARSVPRHGKLTSFSGPGAETRAYRMGQWLLATGFGNRSAASWCARNGVNMTRSQNEGVNEKGGFLVPDEFGMDIVDLVEKYGVFRQYAKIIPMNSDRRMDPVIAGELTSQFVGELQEVADSDLDFGMIGLTAQKHMILVPMSSEVSEDAAISIADTITESAARAFAKKEDLCGFSGDATSAYGGIVGVCEKLKNVDPTIANIAGLQVGTGNAYSELTLLDFQGVVARLPEYADTGNARWFMSRSFYWNVVVKLVMAAPGATASEIEDARNGKFLGYGVTFVQVMPKVEANSQVCAVFGDLAMGARLGDRRKLTIAIDESILFRKDALLLRATSRFDINVHGVGNASATAALRVPGPIVGLITAAS